MPLTITQRRYRSAAAVLSSIVVLLTWGLTNTHAQPASTKFAQFGDIKTEDAMARLDQFALELRSHPDWRGIIMASNESDAPRGTFLRLAHGYRNYLVNARGIEDARIRVVEAEPREETSFELWTMPVNQLSAVAERDSSLEPPSPQLFDRISIGPEAKCFGELSIELYKLEDGLRFLREALQQQSRAKAWIVIHPPARDSQATIRRTMSMSRRLLGKHGIKADRILTAVSSRQSSTCGEVRMWIAPSSSARADEAAYYSQLMNDAEAAQYTARRVEFSGNQHVRDGVLRKQLVQQEGDVFSRRLLDQSLKNFNSLGLFYPVTLQNIEARLDRENRLIDLTISFRERQR